MYLVTKQRKTAAILKVRDLDYSVVFGLNDCFLEVMTYS
jgi:hypothetical protein